MVTALITKQYDLNNVILHGISIWDDVTLNAGTVVHDIGTQIAQCVQVHNAYHKHYTSQMELKDSISII